MNCDQAIEYLPWLLNGTLEAGEKDEVRRHLATCERCRAALNDTRDAWTIFGQHLPGDVLVALAYGETPAGVDPAVVERHLASCPECAAELELARMSRRLEEDKIVIFPGPRSRQEKGAERGSRTWRAAAMAAGLAGLVAGTGWIYEFQQAGSLAERLAQKPAAIQQTRPVAPAPPGATASPRENEALKSQLQAYRRKVEKLESDFDATAGKLASVEQTAGSLLKPTLNPWSDSVSSDVVRDGSTGAEPKVQVPSRQLAFLVLNADSANAIRDIEILDSRGAVFWSGSGLRSTKDQEYTPAFPPGFLRPGHYTIQLYSNENGRRVKRESYKIRVE